MAWLVSRRELNARVIAEHAIILPESLIDRDAQPHAHRWLLQQPLVCVSGTTWRRLSSTGVRVYRVAFDATNDRLLDVEGVGGTTKRCSLTVGLGRLDDAVIVACKGRVLLDIQGDPSPIDRLLRQLLAGSHALTRRPSPT